MYYLLLQDTTSWALIIGTGFFSVLYNFSRFFEYTAVSVVKESAAELELNATSEVVNETVWEVRPTDLRMDRAYIQYYILMANFIVMGILPFVIMIIFNVLVVRAVDEANKRR